MISRSFPAGGDGGGAETPDATTSTKGKARLLGGTAEAPTVPWAAVTGAPSIPDSAGDIGAQPAGTYVAPGDLADVATSGSYDDLDDKPTIPAAYDDTSVLAALATKPSSDDVDTIVVLTQSAYDAIPEKDERTLYVVSE